MTSVDATAATARGRETRISAAAGAGAIAGIVLLAVYLATLAPDVTFWDAGEFIAAAKTLGIPHPPGTPLVTMLHNVWARLLFFLPFALATNSVSAVATAAAGAFSAAMLVESAGTAARGRGLAWSAVAGALCAGGMSTVWLNATETEVYSVGLALAAIMLWAAQRAGRRDSARWRVLTGYLIVLTVPLHLSALVAAPAAAYLASTSAEGDADWGTLASFGGLFLATMAFGKMSWPLAAAGLAALAVAPVAARHGRRATIGWTSAALFAVGVVAASAVIFLLVRSRFDPAVNQGNPSTWNALADEIARRQYDVPGIWPRQAPFWLQVANMFQYADWQVGLALAPGVVPSVGRVVATVAFSALGVTGSLAHRRDDHRGWRALAILLVCGTLGIVVYVNFRAGPSFGYGILPDSAIHEARDRDYFYYLGFWVWGLWAGYGAVALARRWRRPAMAGVALAALPIALNWSVVSRRQEPGAELPRAFAESILGSTPPGAVLIVAGDNDSYPLWYMQQVHHFRSDVTMVTSPLLNAPWYQREMTRRDHLLAPAAPYEPELGTARRIARAVLATKRPLAVSILMPASERNRLAAGWSVHGMVYVADTVRRPVPTIDSEATRQWRDWVARWQHGREAPLAIDPSDRYYLSLMSCPALYLSAGSDSGRLASLDSTCNRR